MGGNMNQKKKAKRQQWDDRRARAAFVEEYWKAPFDVKANTHVGFTHSILDRTITRDRDGVTYCASIIYGV